MNKDLANALKIVERELGVKIRRRKLSELKQDPQNTRKHNDRNRGIIVESMKEIRAFRSVGVDANDVIRAGNATVSVAPSAGITEGIEIETDGRRLLIHKRGDMTDERTAIRASVADNASTDASTWDVEALTFHMRSDDQLFAGILDDDDDVLHKVRKALAGEIGLTRGDVRDLTEPANVQTKRGDVWICGRHRVMCGSSLDSRDMDALFDGKKMQFVYGDPPYGIQIVKMGGAFQGKGGGAFGGKGKELRGAERVEAVKYAPVIGDESTHTATEAFRLCMERKIRRMIWWGANHYASALPDSKCWIVWDKETGENNFADAELAWTNSDTAVRIFRHQWNGLLKESERDERRVHPTQKPVALAAWCLEKYGASGDNVYDPFGGSGSLLLACEVTQRNSFTMELSEPYVDIIVARWEHATGQKATRITKAKR